jgi:hypothetical protein
LNDPYRSILQAFPWDYKTAELGAYRHNITTGFIDLFAKIGWAYDLKTVDQNIIDTRMSRTGNIILSRQRRFGQIIFQYFIGDGTKTNIWGFSEEFTKEK